MGDAGSKLESSESDLSERQSEQTTPTCTEDGNRGHRTDTRTVSRTFKTPGSGRTRTSSQGSDMTTNSVTPIARTRFQKKRMNTVHSLPAGPTFEEDEEEDSDEEPGYLYHQSMDGRKYIQGPPEVGLLKPDIRSYSENDSRNINLLEIPQQTRPNSPIHFDGDIVGPDDDPFEGLILPRKRINSIGSISVYSVREISDGLYKDYFRRIKLFLKSHGVFDRFPTPDLLAEAQKLYRRMELPAPIDDDDRMLPHPPRFTIQEAFGGLEGKFDQIKERVLKFQMPIDFTSKLQIESLTARLCKDMEEDIQKLVTIATYLLCQHLLQQDFDHQIQETPEDVCKVFHTMCKSAQIKSKLVRGFVRGPGYLAGENIERHRGIWISALVDCIWCIVDPFSKIEQFTKKTADFPKPVHDHIEQYIEVMKDPEFLFEDPVEFIYSHFPDDEYWQLLARCVSKDELPELALLREGFFDMDLSIVKQPKSVVIVDGKSSVISLSWTDERVPHFKCSLYHSKEVVKETAVYSSETQLESDLSRFSFLETNLTKQVVNTLVRFPHIGEYLLDIYGSFKEGLYDKISSYRFIYASYQKSDAFPPNAREEWGPGLDASLLGLTPLTHSSGEIVFTSNVLQIEFKDDNGIHLESSLVKNGTKYSEGDIKLAFLRDHDNDVTFVVDFKPDITGEFVLQIFAKTEENGPLIDCCHYLLKKEKSSHIPRFFFDKEMHDDSDFLTAPESGTIQLEVDCEDIVELNVELKLKLNFEKMVPEHSRYWIIDKKGIVELNFPWKGKYIVRILGRCRKKSRERLLRSETIQVEIPSEQWSPFPKLLEYWSPKVKLISPLTGHWMEKAELTLTVEIPGAHDVAIVAAGGWYHLSLQENGGWKGYVWTGAKSTKCKLEARFEKGTDVYCSLLWFKVISEYDYKVNQRRQVELRKMALKKAGLVT